ncbi:GNAT family N-acetyltransferase [Salinispirillum sp. LH 10-3-1]|uniref:GNAT family N-acetyltransferase n=1 Tax=Salinispirillum sp. LH 10-3-1 TaxID=2952525 RepID=A0AB38YFW4_9GAMM
MIHARRADPHNDQDANAIVTLLNGYAMDPMGGGEPLSDFAQSNLINELRKRPTAHIVLGFVDDQPAGLVNCFEGFSTFACKPILNIHDVTVDPAYRGKGLSTVMLDKVEDIARELGCCKLTLEVLEGNTVAQAAYERMGFAGYELDPAMGRAMFWQKKLG